MNSLSIGDIVLVKDEKKSRLNWRKGKIQDFIYGNDKLVRGVKLLVFQKTINKTTSINRPLQYIVPLEVSNEKSDTVINDTKQSNLIVSPRSKRTAAKDARMKMLLNDMM